MIIMKTWLNILKLSVLCSKTKKSDIALCGAGLESLVEEYKDHFGSALISFITSKKRFTKSKLFGAHNQSNMEMAWQAVPFWRDRRRGSLL